jgi:hypothetical protein
MVRYASLFSQLIAVFNRNQFYHLVLKHRSERYAKGYNSWDHFIAMLFCQLAQAKSLREICGGLACCLGKLRHLSRNGGRSCGDCITFFLCPLTPHVGVMGDVATIQLS